jgi:uncharacterized protein (DUF697 family)
VALPIKPGAVYGVVKELGKNEDRRPLLVAGLLADELARELTAGGDPAAVRVGGSPDGGVIALLLVIGDTVTDEDERILKTAHRGRVPAIVVVAGATVPERIPFALATDVVRARPGRGFPVEAIAEALAAKLGENATSLAHRLPVVRPAVVGHLIDVFSRKNALVAVAVFIPGADLPALTVNQIRMVLRICASYGLAIDRERAIEILATVGVGLGLRTLARELLSVIRVGGWAVKGTVAYAGTRAIGEAAVRYCEARAAKPQRPASALPVSS